MNTFFLFLQFMQFNLQLNRTNSNRKCIRFKSVGPIHVIIEGSVYVYFLCPTRQVMYNVNGFLEKNRDTLPADIVVVLRTSENKLLQQLFSSPLTKTGRI